MRLDAIRVLDKNRDHEEDILNRVDVMRVLLTGVRGPGKIFGQGDKAGCAATSAVS